MSSNYWSWLSPLLLALSGAFFGALLGTATITQMLLWPFPLLHAARQPAAVVGSILFLAQVLIVVAATVVGRKSGWLKNELAFGVAGLAAYSYAAFSAL